MTPDTGLACLALIAQVHGKAAQPSQLAHELGLRGPAGAEDMLLAAKRLGLKASLGRLDLERAASGQVPLPCVAEMKGAPAPRFVVLGRVEGDKVLAHDPEQGRPVTLTAQEFRAASTGRALFITSRATLAAELARFDFSWFIPALIRYRRLFGETLVASAVLGVFALATPLFFQVVMDKVLVHKGYSTLTVIAIGLLATVLFESLLSALRTYVLAHTTSRIDVELGARLYRHLLSLPLHYFEARRVGDSVARVRELEHIRQFLTGPALTSIIDLAFTFVFLAVMYYYSPLLTLIVALSIPCYVGLLKVAMPAFRKELQERFRRGAENQAFLVESVSAIQTLKAGATEPQAVRRWDEQLAAYVASSFRVARLAAFAGEAIQLVPKLVTVGVLWIGAREVIDGAMTVGGLVAFTMLAGRVAAPVVRLAQLWQELQQVGVSVERLADILDTRSENALVSRAQLPPLQGRIELERVRFRYRPEAPEALRDVSFKVEPGTVLGIVGHSGSGKSTLAKLVQRLYVPERGRVLVDGIDLAQVDPAWLRRQIGVVLQENRLFARSVRENIALADPGLPMEAVIQAAKHAGAHEFILELENGYDTQVGEQGATLSGGQRQRIAIARALITNPRILIFDEATSSLDYESERTVHDNMRFIARGRTLIVIAHRLTAVRDASHILVLEKGEVAEQGTHAELMRVNGRYAKLHALQSAGGEA